MKLINNFIVNVQNKFFNNHRSITCKVNVFFLIRAREQRARVEARSALSVKRFYLIESHNNNIIFFENSMISVPSIASWEFTNQISTKSVEY